MRQIYHRQRAASVVELGLIVGLIAIIIIASLSQVGSTLSSLFGITENTLRNTAAGLPVATNGSGTEGDASPPEEEAPPTYASCAEWVASGAADFNDNGVNEIYPNGTSSAINVYCQGAKTLIVAQYENDRVTNWNEGIQTDYDPTLATQKGFALSTSEIPSHSKIYFGQDLATPAYCITGTYTTGDLASITTSGSDDGLSTGGLAMTLYPDCSSAGVLYFMSRDANLYYSNHNPQQASHTDNQYWFNTLSLELYMDASGFQAGNNFNWAFAPMQTTVSYRGYAYNGSRYGALDSQAWTVWVE